MLNFIKPKYIRKQDFIRYFNRPSDEWFWPTQEILNVVENRCRETSFLDEEDDEENIEEKEFDFYEYFLEQKTEKGSVMDLDLNDPKIIEGMIIDKKSKTFIASNFTDCIVYDFEKIFKKIGNHEEQAHRTLQILKENESALLFQPTFIFNETAIAKPDALIKKGNKLVLIETKATSKTKAAHIFDVMYQAKIIENVVQGENIGKISDIKLCLVKYELAKKNDVTFVFCDQSEIKANIKTERGQKKEKEEFPENLFSEENLNEKQNIKLNKKMGIKFIDIYLNNFESNSRWIEKTTEIINSFTDKKMADIFRELKEAVICEKPKFLPCEKYNWIIKKAEHLPDLKKYWRSVAELEPLHYSGYVIQFKNQLEGYKEKVKKNESEKWILNAIGNGLFKKNNAITNFVGAKYKDFSWKDFYFDKVTKQKFFQIKKNKVYFDFESLNQAIRVVDETPPFMQTINQVSIIFEKDGEISESNNILCDPQKIDLNFFKYLIDSLLPKDNPEQYSYIVYNKTFESTCLRLMANLIKEKEYFDKVKIIVKNIVDLADYFDIRKEEVIVNKKLFGFYSIKRVLPIILEYDKESFQKAKCKDYKKLEQVQHGGHAQSFATRRFFERISDQEWETVSNNLKIYCENDVRAMIAINFFIEKIILESTK